MGTLRCGRVDPSRIKSSSGIHTPPIAGIEPAVSKGRDGGKATLSAVFGHGSSKKVVPGVRAWRINPDFPNGSQADHVRRPAVLARSEAPIRLPCSQSMTIPCPPPCGGGQSMTLSPRDSGSPWKIFRVLALTCGERQFGQ